MNVGFMKPIVRIPNTVAEKLRIQKTEEEEEEEAGKGKKVDLSNLLASIKMKQKLAKRNNETAANRNTQRMKDAQQMRVTGMQAYQQYVDKEGADAVNKGDDQSKRLPACCRTFMWAFMVFLFLGLSLVIMVYSIKTQLEYAEKAAACGMEDDGGGDWMMANVISSTGEAAIVEPVAIVFKVIFFIVIGPKFATLMEKCSETLCGQVMG